MSDELYRLYKRNLQAIKIDRRSESEKKYIFVRFSMDLSGLSFVFLDTLCNIHSFKL